MSELRWNPLLNTWTIVAANRQQRPNLPKDFCPFCPGEGKNVPEDYEVYCYQNDFPALSEGVEGSWSQVSHPIYGKAESKGNSEVLLYTSDHYKQLYDLSDAHVFRLIELWVERHQFYLQQELVKYIFLFENRGRDVGVTISHPHGQLYAFPYIPLKIETELKNAQKYFDRHGRNLFEDMLAEERKDGRRIIFETEYFLIYLPYFTDYPYGVFVVSKENIIWVNELNTAQKQDLARVLKKVSGMFDTLFETEFPYMMCVHQGAVNSTEYASQKDFFRFHIEYYTPWRAKDVVKYYASSESGAWAATNTVEVEQSAVELRAALKKYTDKYD